MKYLSWSANKSVFSIFLFSFIFFFFFCFRTYRRTNLNIQLTRSHRIWYQHCLLYTTHCKLLFFIINKQIFAFCITSCRISVMYSAHQSLSFLSQLASAAQCMSYSIVNSYNITLIKNINIKH